MSGMSSIRLVRGSQIPRALPWGEAAAELLVG